LEQGFLPAFVLSKRLLIVPLLEITESGGREIIITGKKFLYVSEMKLY
jgi:hypothetical protein